MFQVQLIGGALFLYEIGKISSLVQAKLFRYLQDKEFERLGNLKIRKVDTRIIAATDGDLSGVTAAGEFRQDLYHRLSVFPILIPPLRQRREDIVGLLSFFTQFLAKENLHLKNKPTPWFVSGGLCKVCLQRANGNWHCRNQASSKNAFNSPLVESFPSHRLVSMASYSES